MNNIKRMDMIVLFALFYLPTGHTFAQRRGAAADSPANPRLLLNMTLHNETPVPLTPSSITPPNVAVRLYGDGNNIVVAVGRGANFPRTFFGLCQKRCGFPLRDRNSYVV